MSTIDINCITYNYIMSNHNRDINCQNKAASVIDATIYSYNKG